MRLFSCSYCKNTLYFENDQCVVCGMEIGFDTRRMEMVSLVKEGADLYHNYEAPDEKFHYCGNKAVISCNWLSRADSHEKFCISCRLNKTIPNLTVTGNTARWQQLEAAKKRLIYSLLSLKLPFRQTGHLQDSDLQFEFLSDEFSDQPVLTGHLNGVITINVEEADEIHRHITQLKMGEKYRTVLGHFRHESGHFYWNRLIRDGGFMGPFRALFGNEEAGYSEALQRYYENGAPSGWEEQYISEYASAHPWEDWAETWANYLHILDSMETAWSFGMQLKPAGAIGAELTVDIAEDPYNTEDFQRIIAIWVPMSIALNNLNRSMGNKDFYTFYISPKVAEKLSFIHNLCRMWNRQFS